MMESVEDIDFEQTLSNVEQNLTNLKAEGTITPTTGDYVDTPSDSERYIDAGGMGGGADSSSGGTIGEWVNDKLSSFNKNEANAAKENELIKLLNSKGVAAAIPSLVSLGGGMLSGYSKGAAQDKAWKREDEIRIAERARKDRNSLPGQFKPGKWGSDTGLLASLKKK